MGVAILGVWSAPARAQELPIYALTTAQYQYGFNWSQAGGERRDTLTIEHANAWEWGDNFAFIDVSPLAESGNGHDPAIYGEWDPRLSIRRISGASFRGSIVSDVLVAAQLNFGTGGFLAHLEGAALDFDLPGFVTAQLHAYLRDDVHVPGLTFQITGVWILPFTIGGSSWRHEGYFDLAGPEGASETTFLSQLRLYLDLGAFGHAPEHVYFGTEVQIWINALGRAGQHELVPQPAVRVSF